MIPWPVNNYSLPNAYCFTYTIKCILCSIQLVSQYSFPSNLYEPTPCITTHLVVMTANRAWLSRKAWNSKSISSVHRLSRFFRKLFFAFNSMLLILTQSTLKHFPVCLHILRLISSAWTQNRTARAEGHVLGTFAMFACLDIVYSTLLVTK